MTNAEILAMLESVTEFKGKVAYRLFKEQAPAFPYICFYEDGTDNFKADGTVYFERRIVTIELYTKIKDPTTEALLKGVLDSYGIPWDYSESYIDTEQCFLIAFEVEV